MYVVDTLRVDALACYGNPKVKTPNFDAFANQGTRFTRAYATSSWTRATVGSLFTGQYPTVHGAVDRPNPLRADLPTLAAQLRAAGYRTAAIIANPNIGSVFGFSSGFDTFVELYSQVDSQRPILPSELIATADKVVDAALDWIAQRPAQPFFLFVFTIDPHTPYTPPPPYNRLYDPDYQGNIDGSLLSLYGLGVFGPIPPEREIRHLRALYDGEVAFNDLHFGRLLQVLDRPPLRDNTVTIVTSDHGEEFYDHGGRDHGHTLYDELIHVPLMVRWPGHIGVHTSDQPVELLDLFPTVLQLAGAKVPAGPGQDLSAALLGNSGTTTGEAFAELGLDHHRLDAVVENFDKAIRNRHSDKAQQFNLATDPHELTPQAPAPGAKLVERLATIRAGLDKQAQPGARTTEIPESVRRAMEALGYGDPQAPKPPTPVIP